MSFINQDFRFHAQRDKHPRLRWLLFAASCAVLGVVLANTHSPKSIDGNLPTLAEASHTPGIKARQSFQLTLPELQAQQEIIDEINDVAPQQWREFKVKRGDSLAQLFKRAGIQPQQLHEMMQSGKAARKLNRIHPGDTFRALTDDVGNLQALHYEIDTESYLLVERKDDVLVAEQYQHEIETRMSHAYGEIDSSLFMAANDAGISTSTTMELAGIFGWDIDFALDIRKGDRFSVVYEELFRDGEKIADGNILAAEFINGKRTYRAVRYTNPQTGRAEYFSPDGKSMRKAFLRSPVDFTRISSRFTTKRYHPLLHKFRSHKGVDYAARMGTPIRSAGDGKVVFRGNKGGYGRVLILQHGNKYSTVYAHLKSYARRTRVGSRVKQGQTIAYVGKSGLATGPHLHYEFRVNGVHRNPLTVRFPDTKPVPERYQADFEQSTTPMLAQLDLLTRTRLAFNSF